ncbi:MAG: hypothetical protein EBU33_03635, partial [Sphingobacteriia bacterium]|nr:hypothetical protein [Sphingobacteriia bacterium]
MNQIIESALDEDEAIKKLYEFLLSQKVISEAVRSDLVKEINETRPSVGSGRRLLSEDVKYIWVAIQKILIRNNVITPEQLSTLVLSMDAKKKPDQTPAPSTSAPSTSSPSTSASSTSSQPPSLKKKMLDIINSAEDRNDAIRKIFILLHLSEHSVPLATHEDLLNAYNNQEPKITNLVGKMRDANLFTSEDLRKIWLSIRMVILETKVLDPSELLELIRAMDTKPFNQPGEENPNDDNFIFFESASAFGSDSYDFVIGILVSLIHFPKPFTGDLLNFINQLAYLPNGFTYRFITQIARTFLDNVINTNTFVNIIGSFLQASQSGGSVFSWAGTVLANQMSLFLFGAFGSTVNTLLRILWKYGIANPTKFKVVFSTWFLLLQWLFFGLAPGKVRLTKNEIVARAGRLGTIDVQRWYNLLINSFLYINDRKEVLGGDTSTILLSKLVAELGDNSVFQIVDFMNRPFDLTQNLNDNAQRIIQSIPQAQVEQANQIGYVDAPVPEGQQQPPPIPETRSIATSSRNLIPRPETRDIATSSRNLIPRPQPLTQVVD